jgi:hypothetical protein
MAFAGEIGLTGELRPVNGVEKRVKEAFKLGFNSFLLSGQSAVDHNAEKDILTADTLAAALELALKCEVSHLKEDKMASKLLKVLRTVAPGTPLREGLENILRAKTGG